MRSAKLPTLVAATGTPSMSSSERAWPNVSGTMLASNASRGLMFAA
jgi:hypothetical protein